MSAEKVSLTLEKELLAELQHDRLARLLAELELEHGPVEPQVIEQVRDVWPSPGQRTSPRHHE